MDVCSYLSEIIQDLFYQRHPSALNIDAGNMTERIELRKNLQCKPFQWFLDEVYPEKDYQLPRDTLSHGALICAKIVKEAVSANQLCMDCGALPERAPQDEGIF